LLDVALIEQPLPLQVAQLDVIAVDNPQKADTGARQRSRLKTAERAATHHRHARVQQALLPRFTDARKPNLPRVTIQMPRCHTSRWYQPMR
jgi:hypothetical protein